MSLKLVSLARAKIHLYLTHNSDDAELELKIEDASDIVMDYLKDRSNTHNWDEATVPATVRAAVLLVLGALWENREGNSDQADALSPTVTALLHRYRDPALA